MKLRSRASAVAIGAALAAAAASGPAGAWSLEEAAKPYAGTELEVIFSTDRAMPRPRR